MTAAAGPRSDDRFGIPPLAEILYNLAGLTAVAVLAHYLFWVFAIAILPAMLGSVILMGVEQIIIGKDEANVNKTAPADTVYQDGASDASDDETGGT